MSRVDSGEYRGDQGAILPLAEERGGVLRVLPVSGWIGESGRERRDGVYSAWWIGE